MGLYDILRDIQRRTATNWHFVNTAGGDLSIGEVLTLGAGIGSLSLRNGASGQRIRFLYHGVGLGVGVSLSPADLTVSGGRLPNGGIGNIVKGGLKVARGDLTERSFRGFCTIITMSAVATQLGVGLSIVFMGQEVLAAIGAGLRNTLLSIPFAPISPAAPLLAGMDTLIASSKAIGLHGGMSAGFLPGAGIMVLQGVMND